MAIPIFEFLERNLDFLPLAGTTLLLVFLVFALGPALALGAVEVAGSGAAWRDGIRRLALFLGVVAFLSIVRYQTGVDLSRMPLGAKIASGLLILAGVDRILLLAPRGYWRAIQAVGLLSLPLLLFLLLRIRTEIRPIDEVPFSPRTEASARGPAVILLFDAMSRRALEDESGAIRARFPNLAALDRSGARFRDATTNATATVRSIPSILGGRLDDRPETVNRRNLFRDLAPYYDVTIYSFWDYAFLTEPDRRIRRAGPRSFYARRPDRIFSEIARNYLRWILPSSLARSLLPSSEVAYLLDAKEMSRFYADRFLHSLEKDPLRGRAYYLHLLSPHWPYVLERDGRIHAREDGKIAFHAAGTDAERALVFERYLREIEYADEVVGRVTRILHARGEWDSATLVVFTDHGITWDPERGDWDRPMGRPWMDDNVARIPVWIKPPRGAPPIDTGASYRHLDFYPTMRSVLRLDGPPLVVEGRDLTRLSHRPAASAPTRRVLDRSGRAWIRTEGDEGWILERREPAR